jgi:hypothetical protein
MRVSMRNASPESLGASPVTAEVGHRRAAVISVAVSAASVPLAVGAPTIGVPLSVVLVVWGIVQVVRRRRSTESPLLALALVLAAAGTVAGVSMFALALPTESGTSGSTTHLTVVLDEGSRSQ